MKTLKTFLFWITGASVVLAAEPTQIKVSIRYQHVDAKWFADVPEILAHGPMKEGEVGLPSVTAKPGAHTMLEMIHEYRPTSSTAKRFEVPCGVIIEVVPKSDGGSIHLTGKAVLRRSTNKDAAGKATRFEAQEVLIDEKFEAGVSKPILLEDGGQMLITATRVDANGREVTH